MVAGFLPGAGFAATGAPSTRSYQELVASTLHAISSHRQDLASQIRNPGVAILRIPLQRPDHN